MYSIKEMEWRRIGAENNDSTTAAPCPRANMGSCVFQNKVIIFGGHGGVDYQRKNFNDVHLFDFATETWEQL